MLKIKNCEEVELTIDNVAKNQFFFGNEFVLRGARKITGIEVFDASVLAKTPTGANVISAANLEKGYLTLTAVDNKNEVISKMPLSSLLASANNGQIRQFDTPMINPSMCYVTFGDNSTLVLNDVIVFAFYYEQ